MYHHGLRVYRSLIVLVGTPYFPLSRLLGMTSTVDVDVLCSRVEWKITNISQKLKDYPKGQCIWSPEFTAYGVKGMQLEFFPNGYDTLKLEGFCSLFFWCPIGTRIAYQLYVGKYSRSPDEDYYDTRTGHGHTNFCPLAAEIDVANDCLTVGVEILDVQKEVSFGGGLKVIRLPMSKILAPYTSVIENKHLSRCEWHVGDITKRMKQFVNGSSIFSPVFSLAGIRDVQLEFYPNGNANTTKEGYCALYLRCPIGTQAVVTLFIGTVRKGPINVKFDSQAGKGLTDFCELRPRIDTATDKIVVALEMKPVTAAKHGEDAEHVPETLVI